MVDNGEQKASDGIRPVRNRPQSPTRRTGKEPATARSGSVITWDGLATCAAEVPMPNRHRTT
jgi:hypothetical protein